MKKNGGERADAVVETIGELLAKPAMHTKNFVRECEVFHVEHNFDADSLGSFASRMVFCSAKS